MVGQKVGKLVARVAQIQIVEREGSMKRSLNSITANSSRNEEQKIIDTENHGGLEIYFLRQYVIVIPIKENWNHQCRVLKAAYGITAEEEKKMWADMDYGMHVIFGDREKEEEKKTEEERKERRRKKKA